MNGCGKLRNLFCWSRQGMKTVGAGEFHFSFDVWTCPFLHANMDVYYSFLRPRLPRVIDGVICTPRGHAHKHVMRYLLMTLLHGDFASCAYFFLEIIPTLPLVHKRNLQQNITLPPKYSPPAQLVYRPILGLTCEYLTVLADPHLFLLGLDHVCKMTSPCAREEDMRIVLRICDVACRSIARPTKLDRLARTFSKMLMSPSPAPWERQLHESMMLGQTSVPLTAEDAWRWIIENPPSKPDLSKLPRMIGYILLYVRLKSSLPLGTQDATLLLLEILRAWSAHHRIALNDNISVVERLLDVRFDEFLGVSNDVNRALCAIFLCYAPIEGGTATSTMEFDQEIRRWTSTDFDDVVNASSSLRCKCDINAEIDAALKVVSSS